MHRTVKKVISIDIGTTSVKVAVINETGKCLGSDSQEYELITPHPGWIEADPDIYWQRLPGTIGRTLTQAQVHPKEVSAISLSSQGQTFIPLDRNGRVLDRAMVWLDTRAKEQAERIEAEFGRKDYYLHTGYPRAGTALTASMLLWLKEHKPAVFNNSGRFTLIRDFIALRACGRAVTDESGAASSGLYDIQRHYWWSELLEWIGLDPERLSTVVPSGQIIGELTRESAEFLGLASGTPLVSGAWDQLAAAVGAGNTGPGLVTETTGTALAVVATTGSMVFDDQSGLLTIPYVLAGKGVLLAYAPTSGILLKWFRDELCDPGTSYEDLVQLASGVPPGARGLIFLPHFTGTGCPSFEPGVRGAILGLQLAHTRADIARALMESLALLLQECMDILKNMGVKPRTIRALGGGAKNPLLSQIKADTLGIPVQTLAFPEAALMGSAMLALVGIGYYQSLEEAALQMIHIGRTFTPNPDNHRQYVETYQRYKEFMNRIYPHANKARNN